MADSAGSSSLTSPNTFMDIIAPTAKKPVARKLPDHSKTLMRMAVQKPQGQVVELEAATTLEPEVPLARATPKVSTKVSRSSMISRFGGSVTEASQVPAATEAAPAAPAKSIAEQVEAIQGLEQPAKAPLVQTAPKAPAKSQSSRPKKSATKRVTTWSAAVVAIVAIAGGAIFVNSNLNRIDLHIASSKAGFAATLPHNGPSGFSLSGISSASGAIQASFKSNSDSRSYTLSEKKSSFSSSDLYNNYVEGNSGDNLQTVNSGNLTIYIYGTQDATWVNHGIWYVLQDNNALSNQQIIELASSM